MTTDPTFNDEMAEALRNTVRRVREVTVGALEAAVEERNVSTMMDALSDMTAMHENMKHAVMCTMRAHWLSLADGDETTAEKLHEAFLERWNTDGSPVLNGLLKTFWEGIDHDFGEGQPFLILGMPGQHGGSDDDDSDVYRLDDPADMGPAVRRSKIRHQAKEN